MSGLILIFCDASCSSKNATAPITKHLWAFLMNFSWKHVLWIPFLTLGLGGCAAQDNDAVRGVAASWITAQAFDRAKGAVRRNDMAELERAGTEMRRAAGAGSNPRLVGALASELAAEATLLAIQGSQTSGNEKFRLSEESNARYRAALAFVDPASQASLDAGTLNSLGYFLADKGSTRADFERAAVLTRASYLKWDLSGKTRDSNELVRAVVPQDSYAWALFKLGKYEEARVQQEQVWDMARGMGMTTLAADIPFHLGEIYRALGENKKARRAYQAALKLQIIEETRVLVEGGLNSLDLARV